MTHGPPLRPRQRRLVVSRRTLRGRRIKPPRHGKKAREGRRQRFRGYAKQPDETSELVVGAADRQETLVFIFTAYDLWRWGYHRIAQDLNNRGVPAPEGGRWTLTTVRSMLFNPIYLGVEVRHRYSGALYHKLSPQGPVPVSVDQDRLEKEQRKTVPLIERPREEWVLMDKPALKDLLPPAVREAATQRILPTLAPDRKPHPKKGRAIHRGEAARQQHLDSPFLLTRLLRCKQTGHPMRGETAHKKLKSGRKTYRYYFDGSAAVFARGEGAARRVPAEPLEEAVMGAVWSMLKDSDRLRQRVREQVEAQSADPHQPERRDALQQEREKLMLRLKQAYRLLGSLAEDGLADEIESDRQRIEAIDQELKALEQTADDGLDAEQLTSALLARLQQLPHGWDELPSAQLKQLLAAAVENLTLDLETLEVSFTLVLPQQFNGMGDGTGPSDEVRLDCPWPWLSQAQTNRRIRLQIDAYRCAHERQGRRDCYACRRNSAA